MIAGPLQSITAENITSMVDDARPESPTLDFKRAAPVKNDAGRTAFLNDVCAFANSDGGDLVYGVATKNDVASAVMAINVDTESPDALKRRLVGWLDSNVQPRVATSMEAVAVSGGYVLVVRVPASFIGPHWFREHGDGVRDQHRFVLRSGTGTAPMDYTQLRTAFDRSASLAEKARSFRADRLKHVATWQTSPPLQRGPLLVMHLLPLSGIGRSNVLDVPVFYRYGPKFTQPGGSQPQKLTNLDGILITGSPGPEQTHAWHAQVFRSGAFEFARHSLSTPNGQRMLHARTIGHHVRQWLSFGVKTMQSIGVTGPVLVGVSLMHVDALPFMLANDSLLYGAGTAGRQHVELPDHWIEEVSSYSDSRADSKAVLDALWQSFGEVECDLFSQGHEWAEGQPYTDPEP